MNRTYATTPWDAASSSCISRWFNLRAVLSPAAVPIVCSLRLDGNPPALLLVEPDCPEIVVPQPRNSSSSSSTHDCCDLVPIVRQQTPNSERLQFSCSLDFWGEMIECWGRIWVVGCEKWKNCENEIEEGKERESTVVTGEGKSRSDRGRAGLSWVAARNTNAVFLNSTIPTP